MLNNKIYFGLLSLGLLTVAMCNLNNYLDDNFWYQVAVFLGYFVSTHFLAYKVIRRGVAEERAKGFVAGVDYALTPSVEK